VIRETSPETRFMPCPSLFEHCYADFAAWAPYADAITLERQWGYERQGLRLSKLFEVGLSMQVVRALSGRPPVGTLWLGWGVDRDYAPSTAPHYRLNFAEILLHRGTPQLHAQTIFEVDASEMGTVREMFELVEQVRPRLVDAHPVPYAALVVDWTDFAASDHFKGAYQALAERHVPFTVISARDVSEDALAPFEVLILPNVVRLSDEQVAAVEAFNRAGGGVVFTYRTGWARPDGSLRWGTPLASLAGIVGPFGIVTNPSGPDVEPWSIAPTDEVWPSDRPGPDFEILNLTYYRVVEEHAVGAGTVGRLQSFQGSYAEVETTTGKAIAQALDHDYSKMHRHHPVFGWYPGHPIAPLIVVNEPTGRGRAAYFAGEFDRAAYRAGLPGLLDSLAQAAVWAAGAPPPVEVESSASMELATHFSPSRNAYTVLMVNHATNDLRPSIVVRHVEPLKDVAIRLRGVERGVREVRCLGGAEARWEVSDGVCAITLAELREYAAVVVDLA
jgi:hypothetical protein